MGRTYSRAKSNERTKVVESYLMARPGKWVSSGELALYAFKEEIKVSTLKAWLSHHWERPNTIVVSHAKGYCYTPSVEETAPDKKPVEETAPVKKPVEKPLRNSEGYPDPTAGRALESIEPTLPYKPGEVWRGETRLGEEEMLLVISGTKGRAVVLKLWPEKKPEFTMPLRVLYNSKILWTDPSEICWRTGRALTKNIFRIRASEFEFAKKALGKFLGTTFTTEVIKEVPKLRVETQTVEKQDPKLVRQLEQSRVYISELTDKVTTAQARVDDLEVELEEAQRTIRTLTAELEKAKGAPAETSLDLAVTKAKLMVYEELFLRLYPEGSTR